ncbi:hypothetical protein FUAX_31290 [Fulvitalea axinellae]|uniref:RagB/SusD family nutrient uptake outer membrane protein n=1 Tax=Fulvitalea axinellae TaxID=1182444 RepID=A0AAU9CUM5_9BACT|nr:hypothetical protein FUAX_31290 [Fulvitalea axinellae]
MRNILNRTATALLAVGLAFTSCDDLTPENFNQLTPDNFPKSVEDVEASITAIYNDFGTTWMHSYIDNRHIVVNTLCTDELISAWGGGWQQKDRFLWDENTGFVWDLYKDYTKGVTKATLLLDLLENTEISDENKKQRSIAEVKALRAYFAYQVYDMYGPLPLVTDIEVATDINKIHQEERPTAESVIGFIETELKAAIAKLPVEYSGEEDYGRITKGAAMTMLMRLYLHEKNFAKVAEITAEIQALGVYALLDNYNDVFSTATEGNGNTEVILAIPKIADGYGTSWFACVLPQKPKYRSVTGVNMNVWGGLKTPWEFYDKYEEGNDDRLGDALIRYYTDTDGNEVDYRTVDHTKAIGANPKKYREDPDHLGNFSGNDIVRYRYAGVLLARAEALNELNGPTAEVVGLVNQIRNRVNTTPISEDGWNKDTMRDYILDESGRELFCEGHRREDLIRHGKLVEKAHELGRLDAAEHHVLFPIPRKLMDENPNITQNPGY